MLLTRTLPPRAMALLQSRVDLTCNPHDRALTRDDLFRMIAGQHGVVTMLTDRVDGELLDAAPDLKVVANYAVGYNNIDLEAARARGIVVTNTPGVLTDATADLTWALILGITRRIGEGDRLVRAGRWSGWTPTQLLGMELRDSVLGIVGMGRIGRAVASRAGAFGMRVVYAARHPVPNAAPAWRAASLDELLATADVVSLHVPLTDATRHLIGSKQLAAMKPAAYLINTSRGPVVDEAALVEALRLGRIAGAGLDVYEREPEIQAGLDACDNTLLLPHLGSATTATRERMGAMVVENVLAVLEGRRPPNPVEA
ncbi:MAG TPA: D-glycerate dehydrogenase [Nitrospiria bacterium]|nr:D-glycerate dehydrogenase [Nitrospiria bacterium]